MSERCDRCNSENGVEIVKINEQKMRFCEKCRDLLFSKKKTVGRPSVGITEKVSLTLPQEDWDWFDKQAKGNRSQFLRKLVWNAQEEQEEWSNQACLGYVIMAAEKLDYSKEEIEKLVRKMQLIFDFKTVNEAREKYINYRF